MELYNHLSIEVESAKESGALLVRIHIFHPEDFSEDGPEVIHFELNSDKNTLIEFAQKLQTYPAHLEDIVLFEWKEGAIVSADARDKGNVRCYVKVIDKHGHVSVKFELLKPEQFRPGMKFYGESIAEPAALNKFGKSLENLAANSSGKIILS